MQLKSRLKFVDPWSHLILEAAKQCGVSVDEYCTRAVMLTTRNGFQSGEKVENGSEAQPSHTGKELAYGSGADVPERNGPEVRPGQDAGSDVFPDKADV